METELYNEYDNDIDNVSIIEPPNNNTNRFVCDECGQSYKYYSGLYSHKRHHDPNYINKFSCSLCDYSHDNIYHLYSHINTHTDDPAEIITNERKLYRKPSKYIKMYSEEEKNFNCPICGKKYGYRQSMQVHMKTHDKTREIKFHCSECDFKTDHKGHFTRHLNSHM
jgi:hypothetical protein